MQKRNSILTIVVGLAVALCLAEGNFARQRSRTRRSQRVRMEQVQVASPDGNVKLIILPNAERLTFTVTLGNTTVLDPSTIVMNLDGYDLSAGVVFGKVERYEVNETYPWHGVHSTAVNRCSGARISLRNDLSFIDYILDVRVFNDGAAFRHVIPGDEGASRVPDEYTTFVIPAGSTVWYHDLGGHYEAAYEKNNISDVPPGQWMGPPVTFRLPGSAGYASITEANLVNYSGMALEADGRRGLITGLGHRHPLNYPYELRYGNGIIDIPSDVGGWPEYKSTPAPVDSDHDGMPDTWEKKFGLKWDEPSDGAKDADHDGYTNVEEWLNGTDPTQFVDYRIPENNKNTLSSSAGR